MARIYEDSLSGIASKYVALEPGPPEAPKIPDGGRIGLVHTYAEVGIDELFDTFDPLTRAGLRNFVRGRGRVAEERRAEGQPGARVSGPGAAEHEPGHAGAVARPAGFRQPGGEGRAGDVGAGVGSQELTQLISNTTTATGAIARQSQALEQALSLFPGTLTRSTTTFAGLSRTLDSLDPLVAASKPAVRRLPLFACRLETL